MLSQNPHTVLTIAGFDPSSGAGITADLKVFAAHHLYGLAAITALTVQSTQGVRRVEPIPPEILAETLHCLAEDGPIVGIKIGMLATQGNVIAVSRFLAQAGIPSQKVVLDPILRSSSGRELLSQKGIEQMQSDLLPLIGWITPNIEELAILSGVAVRIHESIPEAAQKLARVYPNLNIVVTGGHLDPPNDFLRTADEATQWFPGHHVQTTATHGTGCTFSSALLANLVRELPPVQAVAATKTYVTEAMQNAQPIGKGKGPLHHLYRFK